MNFDLSKKRKNSLTSNFLFPTSSFNKGFTLLELLLVMAITAILMSLSMLSLTTVQHQAYLDENRESLLSDFKSQQLKAMTGNTGGGSSSLAFGIRFSNNNYTLFQGSTYNASDPTNFTFTLKGSTRIVTTVPQSQVVFTKGSGEITGYDANNRTITIEDTTTNEQKSIVFNRLGVFETID
ncbi:MAG: Tfp pilus assembly protein FimT/FimU [Weeksellaceae bacterium]